MCWSCKHTGTRITRAPVFTWLPGCNWSSWPLSALWYYMFSHCPDVSGCICENHKCVCVDACTIFFILMYLVWFELCSRSVLIREHTHVYIFQHTGLSNIVKFPSLYACVHIYTHYVGWHDEYINIAIFLSVYIHTRTMRQSCDSGRCFVTFNDWEATPLRVVICSSYYVEMYEVAYVTYTVAHMPHASFSTYVGRVLYWFMCVAHTHHSQLCIVSNCTYKHTHTRIIHSSYASCALCAQPMPLATVSSTARVTHARTHTHEHPHTHAHTHTHTHTRTLHTRTHARRSKSRTYTHTQTEACSLFLPRYTQTRTCTQCHTKHNMHIHALSLSLFHTHVHTRTHARTHAPILP